MLFHKDRNVLALATTQATARNLVSKVKFMWENLPSWLKVDAVENNKLSLHLVNGSKKFYVYVRKPGGGIKKVSFGQAGMSAKINDPKARRAFAARHDCKNKKDRTKASYWSCRLPRYAKLLGLKSSFSGFW